jgi:putative membrane protein
MTRQEKAGRLPTGVVGLTRTPHGRYECRMTVLLGIAAVLAALMHVLFFLQESVWWMRPAVHRKTFGLDLEQARTVRLFAYNQGFYNLFLAAGAAGGLAATLLGHGVAGRPVLAFACASMAGAALVLVSSKRTFWLGALLQGMPPAIALAALAAGG